MSPLTVSAEYLRARHIRVIVSMSMSVIAIREGRCRWFICPESSQLFQGQQRRSAKGEGGCACLAALAALSLPTTTTKQTGKSTTSTHSSRLFSILLHTAYPAKAELPAMSDSGEGWAGLAAW